MNMDLLQAVISILTGLAVCIPLVVELVKAVRNAIREKNWTVLMKLVMDLMEEAEHKFELGAEKKEWVMGMIQASAATINFDIDYDAVSAMIDSMCDMSRIVNGPKGN